MDLTRRSFIKVITAAPLVVYFPALLAASNKEKALFDIIESEVISFDSGLSYVYRGLARSRKINYQAYFMYTISSLNRGTVIKTKEKIQDQLRMHFSRNGAV